MSPNATACWRTMMTNARGGAAVATREEGGSEAGARPEAAGGESEGVRARGEALLDGDRERGAATVRRARRGDASGRRGRRPPRGPRGVGRGSRRSRRDRDARRGAGDAPSVGVAVRDDIAEMIGIGSTSRGARPHDSSSARITDFPGAADANDSRREIIDLPADGVGLFSVCRVRAPEEHKRKKRRDPGCNRMGKQSVAGFASWRHHVASSTVAG